MEYFSEIVRNVKNVRSSSEVVANAAEEQLQIIREIEREIVKASDLVKRIASVVDSFQNVLETLKVEKLETLAGRGVGPGAKVNSNERQGMMRKFLRYNECGLRETFGKII